MDATFLRSLAVSIGMALATSCFAMLAALGAVAGRWLPAAIAASLVLVLAVASAVGRLARRFPSAPGVRTYAKAAFGDAASLTLVLLYLVVVVLVGAVESQLFVAIVQHAAPGLDGRLVLPLLFGAVFALNAAGHAASRGVQLALVAAMLAAIVVLAVAALVCAPPDAPAAAAGGVATLPAAAVGAFFLFVGFEWVTSVQPPSRRAAQQLPRVLWAAVAVLGGVYLLFAAAMLAQLDAATLASTRWPQLLLAERLWGLPGRWAMVALGAAAVGMAFNAGVLGAARLVYGLAREGALPRRLAAVDGRGTPIAATAAAVGTAFAASLAVGALQASALAGRTAAVLICVCYAGLLAASLRLAGRDPAPSRRATVAEAGALAAMLALLAAMLADPSARAPAAAAVATGLAAAAAARAIAGRGVSQAAPLRRPA